MDGSLKSLGQRPDCAQSKTNARSFEARDRGAVEHAEKTLELAFFDPAAKVLHSRQQEPSVGTVGWILLDYFERDLGSGL